MYTEKQKQSLQKFLEEKYKTSLITRKGLDGFSAPGLLMIPFDTTKEGLDADIENLKYQAKLAWGMKNFVKNVDKSNFDTPLASYLYHLSQDLKRQPMMEIYEEGSFEGFYYAVMNDYLEEACA
jgi:hypothetical protein